MTRQQYKINHRFVEIIPEQIDDGVLYISKRYNTAVHKCCCGCGEEVVTPLNRTDWSLRVTGGRVTLYPSIGNWSYKCQSHYWIRRSQIMWAGRMSRRKIERGRELDHASRKIYFEKKNREKDVKRDLPSQEKYLNITASPFKYFLRAYRSASDYVKKIFG